MLNIHKSSTFVSKLRAQLKCNTEIIVVLTMILSTLGNDYL